MSLLFDDNLSHRLIRCLEAAYPRSEHVELVGLKGQVDLEVWEYTARHDATIVSKDTLVELLVSGAVFGRLASASAARSPG